MTHRAEVLFLNSEEVDVRLGEWETAIEARSVCAKHEGGVLYWTQQFEDRIWEAQGRERWYWAVSRRRTKGEEHA